MWASAKHLLACAILLAIGHASQAEYDVNAYCKLVKEGTKLGSIESCQTFYTCQKGVATKQSCSSTQSFDKSGQTCKPTSQVDCYYDVANPCATAIDGTFVPVSGTCDGWIYCKGGKEANRGSCGALTFKNGKCTYDECNRDDTGTTTNTDTLQSVCDVMPNNVYFGDFTDCKAWHYCDSSNKHHSGACDSTHNFSIQKGTCSYDECKIVDPGSSIPDTETQQSCTSTDPLIKGHSSKCSVYYTCKDSVYVKSVCATGTFFDDVTKTCKSRQEATPVATCDRCEGTSSQFVNAVDGLCREYLYCKNGVKVSSSEKRLCADGTYFSEASQGCIKDMKQLDKYAEENGACADALLCENKSSERCESTLCVVDKKVCRSRKCEELKAEADCKLLSSCSWDGTTCAVGGGSNKCSALITETTCIGDCKWTPEKCSDSATDVCKAVAVEADCDAKTDSCEWNPTNKICEKSSTALVCSTQTSTKCETLEHCTYAGSCA